MASNYQHGVPACREQGSLRFHLWRHSHSVPVRWRRGAEAEVAPAGAALAVEQVERAAHPEPQATQAAGAAVRVATALLNPPAAKAVRLAMALLNPPAARARIALTRQGRELGRGAPVRTAKVNLRLIGETALPEHLGSISQPPLPHGPRLARTPSVAAPWAGFRIYA